MPAGLRSCRCRRCAQSPLRCRAVPVLPATRNRRTATATVAGPYGAYRDGRARAVPPAGRAAGPTTRIRPPAARAARPGPRHSGKPRRPLADGAPEATRPRPPGPGRSSGGALHLDQAGAARSGETCATGKPAPSRSPSHDRRSGREPGDDLMTWYLECPPQTNAHQRCKQHRYMIAEVSQIA